MSDELIKPVRKRFTNELGQKITVIVQPMGENTIVIKMSRMTGNRYDQLLLTRTEFKKLFEAMIWAQEEAGQT